ncbi:hypothetical protein D3H55_15960 [Bacillus salacetis]|uniref:Peptidase n=1 Tax=Bacillus salacetis TaxID=2315464 RepID=A0A3A1QTB4_9BACI|nr:hypothetical protein [Bacillus salacetis]RIW30880.1 hypothetical protein D3H55_15960 [Bacillus salacetis]
MWNNDSRVVFVAHELHFDKKKSIFEDKVSGDFYEMPPPAIDAIINLTKRRTVSETEELLNEKYPEEEIDMGEFMEQLIEMKLLSQIDDQVLHVVSDNKPKKGFLWIEKAFAEKFFGRVSRGIYLISFISAIVLMMTSPSLIPHYQDFFLSEIILVNVLLFSFLSFVLVMVHEGGHVLAARSLGIPVKISFGHRLFFPVLESDVSEVWRLPARDRNRVYLAGVNFDIVILFLSLLVQRFILIEPEGLLYGVTAMINFNIVLRLIYQCCFYMKTDLYFVVENLTGCYNLMEEAKEFLKMKVIRKIENEYGKVIKAYSLFYIIGTLISLGLFLFFYLPQLFYAIEQSIPNLRNPISSIHFWDGSIFLLQLMVIVSLLFYSWMKGLNQFLIKSKK